jgi:hypothetical protein
MQRNPSNSERTNAKLVLEIRVQVSRSGESLRTYGTSRHGQPKRKGPLILRFRRRQTVQLNCMHRKLWEAHARA